MSWETFKEDSEALKNKFAKGLGLCDVSFACIKGVPYLEIIPVISRIKSEEGLSGLLVEIPNEDEERLGEAIMELAKNNEDINNSEEAKKARDRFEKEMKELFEKYQAEVDAIGSLEI